MKLKANKIDFSTKSNGDMVVELIVKDYQDKRIMQHSYDKLKDLTELSVEVKKFTHKRSLSANGYMWAILQKMAVVLKTTKEELYIECLKKYSKFCYLIAKPDNYESVMEEWRASEYIGEVEVNGKKGIQLRCYFGSSSLNTKEFSHLLEMILLEAKELDIETLDDIQQKELMKKYEEEQKK